MSMQLEKNKAILSKYIPAKSVNIIAQWIYHYNFKLKIKKSRSSKYGDYRPPIKKMFASLKTPLNQEEANHQITINNDLNPYAFLITLIHEIAHLSNWEKHKNKVKPHGEEWKTEYKVLMDNFLNEEIFTIDIIEALMNYMRNPAASSCSDITLQRVLKKYDKKKDVILLEELQEECIFKIASGRYFIKGKKIRKRYKCKEVNTNKEYLFNPLSEVLIIQNVLQNS